MVASCFYDALVIPSPEPVVPEGRRIPDRVFALSLVLAVLVLLFAPWRTLDSTQFTEPTPMAEFTVELSPSSQDSGYAALAELRPDEEPPPAETIAVEEFNFGIARFEQHFIWGASLRNTHGEYAAEISLQVTFDGTGFHETVDYTSTYGRETLPGGEVLVGDSVYVGEDLPADLVADLKVTGVEWYASEDGTPLEPQVQPLSVVLGEVEVPEESHDPSEFSVTVANASNFAVDPKLTAVFHNADGAVVGARDMYFIAAVPPGDSSQEIRIWGEDVPASADLSLTEFVPTW